MAICLIRVSYKFSCARVWNWALANCNAVNIKSFITHSDATPKVIWYDYGTFVPQAYYWGVVTLWIFQYSKILTCDFSLMLCMEVVHINVFILVNRLAIILYMTETRFVVVPT